MSRGGTKAEATGAAAIQLEFLRSQNNNCWGVGLSEEGLVFGSTANGNPSTYLPIPNRYYEAVRGWSSSVLDTIAPDARMQPVTDKVRQVDWHGKFTAAAGHALYTARAYPPAFWNRTAFVTEPTGHLVATFALRPQGADFHSRNAMNLLASDDEWTAPIAAEVGPDGQVWVIDWYNYIVQHNPTPAGFHTGKGNAYETDLRDKQHGRIYRVVHEAAPPSPPLSLADATPAQLVETLRHTNQLWRLHAQRLLVERGQRDVLPRLLELVRDERMDAIGLTPGAIHALWTLHGLGALDGSHPEATAAAVAALRHPSAGVRLNAAKILPPSAETTAALLRSGALDDRHPQVRLAALLALADAPPSSEAAAAVAAMLARPENFSDRWLTDAATSAAAKHDIHFLRAVVAVRSLPPQMVPVIGIVAEHYARNGSGESVVELVAALSGAEPAVTEAVITALANGWPKDQRPRVDEKLDDALAGLLPRMSSGGRGQLLKLAAAWGSRGLEQHAEEIARTLLATVEDDAQADDRRIEAARQLVAFRGSDDETVERLLAILSPRTSPALTAGLIDAAGRSTADGVGAALIGRLGTMTPSARHAALNVLLQRPASTRALLAALEKGQVPLSDLSLDQKQSLTDHPNRRLQKRARDLLARSGGLPNPDRQKVIDELAPLVLHSGEADRGHEVFKQQCAKCHRHGGEGGRIGPDLTGMAVHPRQELLIHILDPNRSVEGNFRQYTILTTEGQVLIGMLVSETKTTLELADTEGKTRIVQREDVDELAASNKSIMPEGFEKQLKPEQLADLLAFLTRRGKYLPLDLRKVATIVSTRGMFYSEEAAAERLIFADWSPKTVQGVPFQLVDPRDGRVPNVVMLYGPQGKFPPTMPRAVRLPYGAPAKAIHLLSGVSGWGWPASPKGTVSLIVRLHYADGQTEDHPLRNGEHFADYIRRVDVPGSEFAFPLRGQQIRSLAVEPQRDAAIETIELVKGPDTTAPVVMAVTVESR